MKRIRICALAAVIAALVLVMPATALADSLDGGSWAVTYTSGGTLEDNYSSSQYATNVSGLQPGDDITMSIKLNHENDAAGDWYMSNEVIKSLEAGAAKGSAYGYVLTYEGPTASRTLYDSQAVGGDNTSGLKEATGGLADYFFLEGLSKGQTGTVKLVVSLDGETEGNDYFNTLAQLKMKFAVDPQVETKTTTKTETRNVAKTGDETDLFPFFVAMAASGVVLLGIAIATLRRRKNEQERGLHER